MVSNNQKFVYKTNLNYHIRNIFRIIFSDNNSLLRVNNSIETELKRIGQKIKGIRLEKKLTQSSLASSCDVDIRTIQLIERGSLNMSLKIFFALSNSLEISPCELLNNRDLDNKGSIY